MEIQTLMECFVHPVQSAILLAVYTHKTRTAKQLAAGLPDVPQATLYRHLKKMTQQGILKVAEEHKVRAVTERVYALALDLEDPFGGEGGIHQLILENRGDVYLMLFSQFMNGLLGEFRAYASREGIDIIHDGSGFSVGPILATDEELMNMMIQIGEVLEPLRDENRPKDKGRRLRSVAVVVTPPQIEQEENTHD